MSKAQEHNSSTKTVGLVVRPGNENAVKTAHAVIEWCKARNIQVLAEEVSARAIGGKEEGLKCEELIERADPIVTLGGDGTLIRVARYVSKRSPVLVGVNFGHLGFLTEVSPENVFKTLEDALAGRVPCDERELIQTEVLRAGKVVFTSQAVNDVVVQKGARSPLIDFDFAVDGEDVVRIRSDGLIFATPTGSTAYSLAAGGSIAHPSLSVVLVTPICPHSLTNRPLILRLSSIFTVTIPDEEAEVLVTVDGQVSWELDAGDTVRVTRSGNVVKFVRSQEKGYFDILRTKLNWGAPNRSE